MSEAFSNSNFVTHTNIHTSTGTTTSIQHLPNELLRIFSFLFLSTPLEAIHHQIYRASAVCTTWFSLIDKTPKFWTRLPKLGEPLSSLSFDEGMGKFETFNERTALPLHLNQKKYRPCVLAEGETYCSNVWECVGDGECLQMGREEGNSAQWVAGEHGPLRSGPTMFSRYLSALLKFLVRSYPLPVEAHLCATPAPVFLRKCCEVCKGDEDFMVYTFTHVFKRARTLSLDFHTSSVRFIQDIMEQAPQINSENFPLAMVNGMVKRPENLARTLREPPVIGRSAHYPYLEDLTVIFSHSATPNHDVFSIVTETLPQAKLRQLNLINAVKVLPNWLDMGFVPPYTEFFCKKDWSTLTAFEGVFITAMADARIVLTYARNLEHAAFTVQMARSWSQEDGYFGGQEEICFEKAIRAGRIQDPLMDMDTIHMPSLRTLHIKLSRLDGNKRVLPPLLPGESEEENGSGAEGPGKDIFRILLADSDRDQ